MTANLPAPYFRKHRLKGRRVSQDDLAQMMGVTIEAVDRWIEIGAPVVAHDTCGPVFDCTEVTRWLLDTEQSPPLRDEVKNPLPPSAQEIADVIGRERALYLIGRLPTMAGRSWRVCLYVPKRIGPDHPLVSLIGWRDANLLVREFGGIILQPSNCRFLHRDFRKREARRLRAEGRQVKEIAERLEVSERQIANLLAAEMSPEEAQP